MDYDSGKYFGLRGPVVHLVGLLRDGSDFASMTHALTAEYDADHAVLEADLQAMLEKLLEADLLRIN